MAETKEVILDGTQFSRLANNFYTSKGIGASQERIGLDAELGNYLVEHIKDLQKSYKIALCFICLNEPYWQYAKEVMVGARQFFLPGHKTDFFFWSDMPENSVDGAVVIPTEPVEWPLPTLFRYSLMLQEEERLKEYDYVFYCDIDMKFVGIVGDEILGPDLTAAQHPMYAIRKEYWPPYEPNPKSTAYIPRPGQVIDENGKPRFMPLYFAGGLQGGKTEAWLKAMKEMKKNIDKDFASNYIAIWNDETHWNRYLFDNPPSVVLTPSYIYPDSLIKEYYEPLWGCSYPPKLITLTKPFTINAEGGEFVAKMIEETKGLRNEN